MIGCDICEEGGGFDRLVRQRVLERVGRVGIDDDVLLFDVLATLGTMFTTETAFVRETTPLLVRW